MGQSGESSVQYRRHRLWLYRQSGLKLGLSPIEEVVGEFPHNGRVWEGVGVGQPHFKPLVATVRSLGLHRGQTCVPESNQTNDLAQKCFRRFQPSGSSA